jgi:hypothetical protein
MLVDGERLSLAQAVHRFRLRTIVLNDARRSDRGLTEQRHDA